MDHPGSTIEVTWEFSEEAVRRAVVPEALGCSAILGFAGSKKLQYGILSGGVMSLSAYQLQCCQFSGVSLCTEMSSFPDFQLHFRIFV